MSHFNQVRTALRDPQVLAAALNAAGSGRTASAEVIVRREHISGRAIGDLGFARRADGSYEAVIDDTDQRRNGPGWLTPGEIRYLAGRRDWPGPWRLAREVPVLDAAGVLSMSGDGWRPADPRERALFCLLARADPGQLARARDALWNWGRMVPCPRA